MKKKTYKLCYLEGNKAIFTDNFEHQSGDDWNDRPYEDNAEYPNDYYTEDGMDYPIELKTLFFETSKYGHDWMEKQPRDIGSFSVDEINRGAVAWLSTEKYSILGGTTLEDFINTIESNGGIIYEPKRKNK